MYKIDLYIPESHLEVVKQAMFAAGAGRLGGYDSCCWQTLGQGQYRPLAGSQPFKGEQDQVEAEAEYKVEMICQDEHIQAIIAAMKAAHPYEVTAYQVFKLEPF